MQKLSDDFSLYKDVHGVEFIGSSRFGILLKIFKTGYVPRSGLFMTDFLSRIHIPPARILDIGTGETGFLAHYLKARGASEVMACDIDCETLQRAKSAGRSTDINWILSDVYSSLASNTSPFDIIISNPPQMPMPAPGNHHDYGGNDGRAIILKILKGCPRWLRSDGRLFILCFDFLGADKQYGRQSSLLEISRRTGLALNVKEKYERSVRKGGRTEENLPWIQKIYPEYNFGTDKEGNYTYKILILEIRHKAMSKK